MKRLLLILLTAIAVGCTKETPVISILVDTKEHWTPIRTPLLDSVRVLVGN